MVRTLTPSQGLLRHLVHGLLLLCLGVSTHAIAAEQRVALVIGNAGYEGEGRLSNPISDARLVADTLRKLGFRVISPKGPSKDAVYEDLDKEALQQAFIDFGKLAKNAEVVFVYYSGHGLRGTNGRNYLVPVKSVIESDDHIRLRSVPVDDLLEELGSAEQQLRIVVLDACRNNPFGDRKKGFGEKGLVRPNAVLSGTLMAFATGEGQTALDGRGSISPYVEALVTRLKEPIEIKDVFNRVARDVYEKTGKKQRPSKVDDVLGEFFLAGRPATPTAGTQFASLRPEPISPTAQQGQGGGLSLEDLEREENTRKQWAQWQVKMKADFDKTAAFKGSADLQVKAWERFLATWAQDNPLSQEDEVLRKQASNQRVQAQRAVQQALIRVEPDRREPTPEAGKTTKACAECPEMVLIPGGSFQMGSNENDREKPIHSVSIKSFELGKYEVTQGQWKAVMGSFFGSGNPSYFKNCGDTCPVEQVSWNDIQEYIKKLNASSGQQYRLPSEAEWEYAARAGSRGKWSFGEDEAQLGQYAWYSSNSGSKPHPVGQKQANAFGLHDMHGNVWEWVQDYYHDSYGGAPTDTSAWKNGGEQDSGVFRGGSWDNDPADLRSAYRRGTSPDFRNDILGFRLAKTVP